MEENQLKSLIKNGEKIDVEFKKAQKEIPKTIYESVCAFNNRCGGHIILGVDDNKKIIGIEDNYVDKIIKDFLTSIESNYIQDF